MDFLLYNSPMHETIQARLLALNARFYKEFAAPFSATRHRLQPGVESILSALRLDIRLLDLGCGNGELAQHLAQRGFTGRYVGLDFSEELLDDARKIFLTINRSYDQKNTSPPTPTLPPLHPMERGEGVSPSSPSTFPTSLPPSIPSVKVERVAPSSPPALPSSPPLSIPFAKEEGSSPSLPPEFPSSPPFSIPSEKEEESSSSSPPLSISWRGGQGGEVRPRSAPPSLWAKLKPLAREKRHEPTPAENALWQALRNRQLAGLKFRRQNPFDRFLVDFYCAEKNLVIEIDGLIHQYTSKEDALRQQYLESIDLHILRFTNDQVLDHLPNVLTTIRTFQESPSSPTPLPTSWGGGQGGEVSAAPPALFTFLQADLSSPTWESSLPPEPFDVITAFAVLHHLPGASLRQRLLAQVRSRLAPGGIFIHSEWQFQHSSRLAAHILPWETIGLTSGDVEPGDTLLDWRQGGRSLRYVHLFNETELAELAAAAGFTLTETFYSDGHSGDLGLYQEWIND